MRTFLTFLPALACAAMMFVCVRMMSGHGSQKSEAAGADEVAELREEVARLKAQRALQKEHIDG